MTGVARPLNATAAAVMVVVALVMALQALPARAGGLQPSGFSALAFDPKPGALLPINTPLTDSNGAATRIGNLLAGKPAILAFEYLRCPNLCGLVLGGLAQRLADADLVPGRDMQFIAVSIDPRETPADAKAARADYRQRFGDSVNNWHLLTGSKQAVHRLAESAGFPYRYDPAIDQYAHPAGIIILSPDGHIARYLLGVDYPVKTLRKGVADAAAGLVAHRPPAPLLLLCYGYDPKTGSYSFQAMRLLRLAALAMILAGGMWWFRSFRRERR